MDNRQLTAVLSTRNWDDLNSRIEALGSVDLLSPLQDMQDLERASARDLLDVVFIDIDEFHETAANGKVASLGGLGIYVVFISDRLDPEAMRDALRAGAKDFLARPFKTEELVGVFERARKFHPAPPSDRKTQGGEGEKKKKSARIITFFTTKGGAGKSTLAANFAVALSQNRGLNVCLVDLSLQFGDLALILNAKPRATILDMVNAGPSAAEDAEAWLTRINDRLCLLPAPTRPEEADLITAQQVGSTLDSLARHFDFIIIDTAGSFNDISLTALDKSHSVYIVVTPIILAVKNLVGTLELMRKSLEYTDDKIRIVLNRCDSREGISERDMEKLSNKKIDFRTPSDGNVVVSCLNRGVPVVTAAPTSKFSKAIMEMASAVAQPEADATPKKSFLKKLFGRK